MSRINDIYTEEELQFMRLQRDEEIRMAKQFMEMPEDQRRAIEAEAMAMLKEKGITI